MSQPDVRQLLSKRGAIDAIGKFLPFEWLILSEDQVTIENFTGSYAVYCVTRSTESIFEPKKVVLRHMEDGQGSQWKSRLEELLVTHESSKMGTGPKLYGITEELMIQEHFKGHPLTPEECLDTDVSVKLAQAFAKFHLIEVPIDRVKYIESIPDFKEKCDEFLKSKGHTKILLVEAFPDFDWDEVFEFNSGSEFEWVIITVSKIGTRRVIVTGDQNYSNVLVAEDENKIIFADNELAKYEPRGLDLGGHFINRTINWKDNDSKASGYEILSKDLRRHFIAEYCLELAKHAGQIKNYNRNGLDSVNHLMEESDIGMLHWSLVWGTRILFEVDHLINSKNSSFCTVAHHLIKLYIKLKDELLNDHPNWSELSP